MEVYSVSCVQRTFKYGGRCLFVSYVEFGFFYSSYIIQLIIERKYTTNCKTNEWQKKRSRVDNCILFYIMRKYNISPAHTQHITTDALLKTRQIRFNLTYKESTVFYQGPPIRHILEKHIERKLLREVKTQYGEQINDLCSVWTVSEHRTKNRLIANAPHFETRIVREGIRNRYKRYSYGSVGTLNFIERDKL